MAHDARMDPNAPRNREPKTARDVMRPPRTVPPEMPVRDLAALLLAERIDGVCVVQGDALVGVVTAMDLVFQEKAIHLPSFFVFLDAFIPTHSGAKAEHELRKITGATVADIMSVEVVTVGVDEPISELASHMVDDHLSLLPVVEGERLVGLIDKRAMLTAAFDLTN